MHKILPCLMTLILFIACLLPTFVQAEGTQTFSVCTLYTKDMSIELPDGWYLNTQNAIDPEFLTVSANSKFKLKQYLTQQHVEYNLVSKDLLSEINVIVLHNSKTKLIYNYNDTDPDKMETQITSLLDSGAKSSKAGETSYSAGRMEKIGDFLFVILEGKMEEEGSSSFILQYSTIVNGFGINISIKSYDVTVIEQNEVLIDQIARSFQVAEIKNGNRTLQVIAEFLPPVLMVLGFIGIAVYRLIKQARKTRQENKEE